MGCHDQEQKKIKQRQREGIEIARKEGRHLGRPIKKGSFFFRGDMVKTIQLVILHHFILNIKKYYFKVRRFLSLKINQAILYLISNHSMLQLPWHS